MNGHTPLLELNDLTVEFPVKGGFFGRQVAAVHAVNQVSMTVYEGETLGLVGESGSGKTTLGRAVLRLTPTTAGTIKFCGKDITGLSPGRVRPLRQDMQMIFQDPFGSLDPRMTVFQIVSEPLVNYDKGNKREQRAQVEELLKIVGLNPGHIHRYPPTSSAVVSGSVSVLPVPWPFAPASSWPMSPSRPSMFPFRPRCSISWSSCSMSSV